MKKKRLLSAFCAVCIGVSALNVPTACLSVNAAAANKNKNISGNYVFLLTNTMEYALLCIEKNST